MNAGAKTFETHEHQELTMDFDLIFAYRMKVSILHFFVCLALFGTLFAGATAANLAVWSFVEVLSGILMMALLLKKPAFILPSPSVFISALLAVLWFAISSLWSPNFHSSLTDLYKMAFLIVLAVVFLNDRDRWSQAGIAAAVTVSFFGSILWLLLPSVRDFVRAPNLFSGFLSIGAVICAGKVLQTDQKQRWVWSAMAFFIIMTIVLLSSLGPVLGLAGGMATLLFSIAKERKELKLWVLSASAFVLLVLFITAIPFYPNPLYRPNAKEWLKSPAEKPGGLFFLTALPFQTNRFHHVWERRMTGNASERFQVWRDSLKMARGHFWKGVGIGGYQDFYPEYKTIAGIRNAGYAHSEPLHILCETGLIGVLLILMAVFFYASQASSKTVDDGVLWKSAVAPVLVQSLFDFNLRYPPIACFFILCLVQGLNPGPSFPIRQSVRRAGIGLLSAIACLAALPGAAFVSYLATGETRTAKTLDPLNAFYWERSDRMRDLEIALLLDPRNVWYHRKAARFFAKNWENGRQEADLRRAEDHYLTILMLAPNVGLFREEYLGWLQKTRSKGNQRS